MIEATEVTGAVEPPLQRVITWHPRRALLVVEQYFRDRQEVMQWLYDRGQDRSLAVIGYAIGPYAWEVIPGAHMLDDGVCIKCCTKEAHLKPVCPTQIYE